MPKNSKTELLEKIKADIINNNVCPELAAGATQLVFGSGNPDAKIVFIGEAPGQKEDQQGLPFVGAAGQFLNEMLESIGLKRQDVYITNIVKYRPPNNRDPYPDEKDAFLPYLQAQLEAIKPKLVITLGRHSLEVLVPGLRISQCHGQPKRIRMQNAEWRMKEKSAVGRQGVSAMQGAGEQDTSHETGGRHAELGSATGQAVSWLVLPLFHPAAALYNGAMRATLIDDFKKIPQIMAQAENLPPATSKPIPDSKVDQPNEPTKSSPTQAKLQFDI